MSSSAWQLINIDLSIRADSNVIVQVYRDGEPYENSIFDDYEMAMAWVNEKVNEIVNLAPQEEGAP